MPEWYKRHLARASRYDMRYFYYIYNYWPKLSWETEEEFQVAKAAMIEAVRNDKSYN